MLGFDYLPSLLAFLFAILATLSRTKDETKSGIRSITRAGWIFVALSSISLSYGVLSIYQQHQLQKNREVIADIARTWIVDGFNLILRPLCGSREIADISDTATIYQALRSKENLSNVGRDRAVLWRNSGLKIVASSYLLPYKAFNEPYQLNDYYIDQGENRVMRALTLFGTHLLEEEIIAVSKLLSDHFLNNEYRLSGKEAFYRAGLEAERNNLEISPWNTVGLHYFDAIYEGPSQREGNLEPVTQFLSKAENATNLLLSQYLSATFAPCS